MPTPTPEQLALGEELATEARMTSNAGEKIAQALADTHATGWSEADDWAGKTAGDRPRGRELDHNTTAHQIALGVATMKDGADSLGALANDVEQRTAAALADAYASGRHDQLADQTGAGLVLTREQLTEVRQTFASMPYGGSLRGHGFGQRPADGVELVGALQDLRAVLRIVGEKDQARTAELAELRRQREAFREYAGAGLLGLLALAKADAPNPLELAHRAEGPEPEGLELLGTAEEAARWQMDAGEQVRHHAAALAAYLHPDDDERARQYIAAAVRMFERTQEPDPLV